MKYDWNTWNELIVYSFSLLIDGAIYFKMMCFDEKKANYWFINLSTQFIEWSQSTMSKIFSWFIIPTIPTRGKLNPSKIRRQIKYHLKSLLNKKSSSLLLFKFNKTLSNLYRQVKQTEWMCCRCMLCITKDK